MCGQSAASLAGQAGAVRDGLDGIRTGAASLTAGPVVSRSDEACARREGPAWPEVLVVEGAVVGGELPDRHSLALMRPRRIGEARRPVASRVGGNAAIGRTPCKIGVGGGVGVLQPGQPSDGAEELVLVIGAYLVVIHDRVHSPEYRADLVSTLDLARPAGEVGGDGQGQDRRQGRDESVNRAQS